jgi:hypothetical protein
MRSFVLCSLLAFGSTLLALPDAEQVKALSAPATQRYEAMLKDPLWLVVAAHAGKPEAFVDAAFAAIQKLDQAGGFKDKPEALTAPFVSLEELAEVEKPAYRQYTGLTRGARAALDKVMQSEAMNKAPSLLEKLAVLKREFGGISDIKNMRGPNAEDRALYESLSEGGKEKVRNLLRDPGMREKLSSMSIDERRDFLRSEVAKIAGKPLPGAIEQPKLAESKPTSSSASTTPPPASNSSATKPKGIAEITKGSEVAQGLLRTFWNKATGSAHIYIKNSQLGQEFIYFSHSMEGVVGAGHNRGKFGDECIITFQKVADRLEVVKQNSAFYFDPQHPLAKAAEANTSDAVLARETIAASDKEGVLISMGNLLFGDKMRPIKGAPSFTSISSTGPSQGAKLNESKSIFTKVASFPENSIFGVRYVLENSSPSKEQDDSEDVADARYISVQVQHSFLAVPTDDAFKPRPDDPRIGYFSTKVTDQISTEATPWRDYIHRWRLVKKDPQAEISEPVQPITFWIENTTPLEFRDIIQRAVLRWNPSFEKAGFKNALAVKVQPDDATWSADDIRYNVLRWTASPKPPFGGYGPSFANPRTGEILGADIMLEFSSMSKRLFSTRVFSQMAMDSALSSDAAMEGRSCEAALGTQVGILRGDVAQRLRPGDKIEMKRLVEEALTKLVLHEVGHTLGLNHNFKASHLHDPVAVHNAELTSKVGLYASVMDYPCVNIAPKGQPQGEYFMTCTGPYDDWAIQYGYSQGLADSAAEAARLAKIAGRSHERELAFGNDADDMRAVGKGIDPHCMIYDMSSDPVTYAQQRCERSEADISQLLKSMPTEGNSYQELINAYSILTRDITDGLTAASRFIGGVVVERAKHGQGAQTRPFTPVPAEKQKQAMALLARHGLGPQAWSTPADLLAHLQKQRRGFDHKENEDPQVHDRVLAIQQNLLSHCLHSTTMNRLLDSELYGNGYSLDSMLSELTAAVFDGDAPDKAIPAMRRNLQVDYLQRLLAVVNASGPQKPAAIGAALAQVESIQAKIGQGAFTLTPGHASLLKLRIRKALELE